MLILLLLLNFVFLNIYFLGFSTNENSLTIVRVAFIKSILVLSVLAVIPIEFLSFFNGITVNNIVLYWSMVILSTIFLIFYKKNVFYKKKILNVEKIKFYLNKHSSEFYVFIFALILIVLPLLFIALFYPPSNSDSMGYHLPRVMHWLQNKNVNHYVTSDIRQLIYQPFAEFVILHIKILSSSDLWVNLVQFLAMIGSVILVTLLVQLFGLNYKFQLLSALFTLSIPMGILQSTTTQNDYVATFFLLAFIFFCFFTIKRSQDFSDIIFSAVSLGLGFLTKSTCVVFAFPFAVYFAYAFLKNHVKKALKVGIIFVAFIFILNFSFWLRNYSLTGDFLGGKSTVNMMKNEYISIPFFISNLIRNIATHLALPLGNRLLNKGVIIFHEKVLNISAQDPAITFCKLEYEPFFAMHEDFVGNFFFLFLLLFFIIYFLFNFKKFKELVPYIFCLFGGFLFFIGLFKWQPWITRLDLPFFVSSVPFVIYGCYEINKDVTTVFRKLCLCLIIFLTGYWVLAFAIKDFKIFLSLIFCSLVLYFCFFCKFIRRDKFVAVLFLSLFIFSIPYVYFNTKRPLLKNKKLLLSSRQLKYFVGNECEMQKYVFIADRLHEFDISKIAIKSPSCINEYYLWVVLNGKFGPCFEIRHIDRFDKDLRYRAIVSYFKNPLEGYDGSSIEFYKELGTFKDPLSIIILKNDKT